jgi:hypothetical protein
LPRVVLPLAVLSLVARVAPVPLLVVPLVLALTPLPLVATPPRWEVIRTPPVPARPWEPVLTPRRRELIRPVPIWSSSLVVLSSNTKQRLPSSSNTRLPKWWCKPGAVALNRTPPLVARLVAQCPKRVVLLPLALVRRLPPLPCLVLVVVIRPLVVVSLCSVAVVLCPKSPSVSRCLS